MAIRERFPRAFEQKMLREIRRQRVPGPGGNQGTKGDKGDTGSQGPTGPPGSNGTNGTNATQIQSVRAVTDAAGLYTWTYPIAYAGGVVPHIFSIAEGPSPVAGVLVNAQIEGTPTNTSCVIRVTKTNASVVALLGLTILSIPASVGATNITIFAKAP